MNETIKEVGMTILDTIQANKVVSRQTYRVHIHDFVSGFKTLCGKELDLNSTKNVSLVKRPTLIANDTFTWEQQDVCLKCLVKLGVIEKVNSYREYHTKTDYFTKEEVTLNTYDIITEYKALVNLNFNINKFQKGQIIKNYDIR